MPAYVFDGWDPLWRDGLITVVSYVALLLLLRLVGQRALAKLKVFDFIVIVALGATFGRALTAKDVTLVEALVVPALLVGLQYLFATMTARWPLAARLFTQKPVLVYFQGETLPGVLHRHRLTRTDLLEAAQEHGLAGLEEVGAIILEGTGTLAVIPRHRAPGASP